MAINYGMSQIFAAAMLLASNEPTPFGNVLASSHNGNLVFYWPSSIESGWQAWLANM